VVFPTPRNPVSKEQPLDEEFSFTSSCVHSGSVTLQYISSLPLTVYREHSVCSVLYPLCYNHSTCTKNKLSSRYTPTREKLFNINVPSTVPQLIITPAHLSFSHHSFYISIAFPYFYFITPLRVMRFLASDV
jgi:hypothetical protein